MLALNLHTCAACVFMTKQRLQIRFSCFIKHHCSYALGPAVVNCLFARGCVRNVFCRRVEPVITKRDCVLYFFKYCGFKILRYDNRFSQKQEKQFPSLFYLCSCNCIVSFVTWCTKNAQFVLKRELTWVPKKTTNSSLDAFQPVSSFGEEYQVCLF